MQIQQGVGTVASRRSETRRFLVDLVEALKASGFVADGLSRSGQPDVAVARPA